MVPMLITDNNNNDQSRMKSQNVKVWGEKKSQNVSALAERGEYMYSALHAWYTVSVQYMLTATVIKLT